MIDRFRRMNVWETFKGANRKAVGMRLISITKIIF